MTIHSKMSDIPSLNFRYIGKEIVWEGKGLDEVGKEKDSGKIRIRINARYFRPTEVSHDILGVILMI